MPNKQVVPPPLNGRFSTVAVVTPANKGPLNDESEITPAVVDELIREKREYFREKGYWLSYLLLPLFVAHASAGKKRDDGTAAVLHEIRQIELGQSQIERGVIKPHIVEPRYGSLDLYFAWKLFHDRWENRGGPCDQPITPDEIRRYLSNAIVTPVPGKETPEWLDRIDLFLKGYDLITYAPAGQKPKKAFNIYIEELAGGNGEFDSHPYLFLAKQEDRADNLGTVFYRKEDSTVGHDLMRVQRYTSGTESCFSLQDVTRIASVRWPKMSASFHAADDLLGTLYRLNRYLVNFHPENQEDSKRLSPDDFRLDLSRYLGGVDKAYDFVRSGLHPFFISIHRITAEGLRYPDCQLQPQIERRPSEPAQKDSGILHKLGQFARMGL